MRRSRFTEEQIIGILKEHEAGIPVSDLCRKHGVSDASIYKWKFRFGGMDISEGKRLKALEDKNAMCGWPPRCKGFVGAFSRWSEACICPAYCVAAFAAGPDEIRGSGPNQAVALEAPRILLVVPISSNDRRVINSFSADAPRAFPAK